MKTYLCLLSLCFNCFCFAQNLRSLGSESTALANSTVSYSHLFVQHINPALLTSNAGFSFGANYSNKFLMKELQFQQVQLNRSYEKSSFGLALSYLGSSLQQNLQFKLGYALKLNETFSMGVNLKYAYLNVNRSEFLLHKVNADLGLHYIVNDKIDLGASLINMCRPKLSETESLQSLRAMYFGIKYKLTEASGVLLQLNNYSTYGFSVNSGIYCSLNSQFKIMFGLDLNNWSFSGGMWFRFKRVCCVLSFKHHATLGISPDFNFEYKSKVDVE